MLRIPRSRFLYVGVNVIFEPASNSVKRLGLIEKFPRLAGGLSASSAIEELVRFLGQPSTRKDLADGDFCELTYETGLTKLKVCHCYGRLQSIELDRLPGSGDSNAYSAGDSPIMQSNPPAALRNP